MLGGAPVLQVDVPHPEFLDAARASADKGRRLAITYFVANRGERAERAVDPVAVVGDRGHWYLQALDHGVGEERWFRVDRIEARETGEPVSADLPPAPGGAGLAEPVRGSRCSYACASAPTAPG